MLDAQSLSYTDVASANQARRLPESLWEQAAEAVKSQDETLFEGVNIRPDDQTFINQKNNSDHGYIKKESESLKLCWDVLQLAQRKGRECKGKQWVRVGEIYESVAKWVQKFVQVGDLMAQVDPLHVGLPWAAIRFILLVSAVFLFSSWLRLLTFPGKGVSQRYEGESCCPARHRNDHIFALSVRDF